MSTIVLVMVSRARVRERIRARDISITGAEILESLDLAESGEI